MCQRVWAHLADRPPGPPAILLHAGGRRAVRLLVGLAADGDLRITVRGAASVTVELTPSRCQPEDDPAVPNGARGRGRGLQR